MTISKFREPAQITHWRWSDMKELVFYILSKPPPPLPNVSNFRHKKKRSHKKHAQSTLRIKPRFSCKFYSNWWAYMKQIASWQKYLPSHPRTGQKISNTIENNNLGSRITLTTSFGNLIPIVNYYLLWRKDWLLW